MTFAVSINPTYKCNLRCDFCYLTHDQLSDSTLLDLDVLDARLAEIIQYKKITQVDVYGGELTLLPEKYINDMFNIIYKYFFGEGDISIITNLTQMPDWLYLSDLDVSVSWDYKERPSSYEKVLENMTLFSRPFRILTLVSRGMLDWDDETLLDTINICNTLTTIKSVELKPYSSNQSNQHDITFKEFEEFVQRWMTLSPSNTRYYEFVNENKIITVLSGKGHAWSDDHLYITPKGDLAVLEFDRHGHEYFMPLYDWFEYLKWIMEETVIINTNKVCGNCEFRGRCLSEHLRTVKDFETNSCSGFKGLLEWYRNTN